MAKRVFEIAKELGVKSKAILEKCQAEGIPNMNNHMSSVSAGLEATIRDWFSGSEGGGTAIETAASVDLDKVRVKPRPSRAKKKAVATATTTEDAPPAEIDAAVATTEAAPVHEAPAAPPTQPYTQEVADDDTGADEPVPVIEEPAQVFPSHAVTEIPAVAASAPSEVETTTSDSGEPIMNVPDRPDSVSPAGPQLETQKPARLSGPKIVRIEAPEAIENRPRAPRSGMIPPAQTAGGSGVGPARGAGGGGGGDRDAKGQQRNRRRTGGAASTRRKGGDQNWKPGGWREQDLVEREARLSRAGGFLRQRRREMKLKQQSTSGERARTAAQTGGVVRIQAPFTIKELSSVTGVKASEIIKKLFMQGIMASVNSGIEGDKAQEVMIDYDIDLQVDERKSAEEQVQESFEERATQDERPRSPVVTILGHVDHGKTSLLDRIRSENVAEGEAGGITQATSAFKVPLEIGDNSRQIVFLDTPGHEAFTAMRARGAHITDIVVLVVAADDGVMPQTIESINHSKAAGVPIVVALNKIDKPEATDSNIQKIFGELAEHGLNPAEWGGDTEVIRTSAVQNEGVTDLLEAIDYQAELLELKADFGGAARGTVIESRVEPGRGAVANVLIQDGLLEIGQFMVCGGAYGRVRDITDHLGGRQKSAGPATPVQVSGLDELPDAGDKFFIVDTLKKAQEAAEQRRHVEREQDLAQPKVTLESMLGMMKAGEMKELRVVIKADVQGSIDVLRNAAEEIQNDEVRVRVLHAAVGGITESDVVLADASQAVIIGFNVIPSSKARQGADQKNIQIRSYDVIYDIIDDLKRAAEGLLEPEVRQEVIGHAEVRAVFKVSKIGAVAGCYVTDGSIERNAMIRVTRGDIVIESDRVLEQLKRFKDDAKEVRAGQECGMKIDGYDDIKEGDILECYRRIEVKRTL